MKNNLKRLLCLSLSICMISAFMFTSGVKSKAVGATPIAIAAGGNHSLALMNDGTVWAWGDNQYGQLGNGTTTNSSTPVQVTGLTGIVAIAAGYDHSMALNSSGRIYAWGDNRYGQIGDLTTTNRSTPVAITMMPPSTKIAAAGDHSLAICGTPSLTGMVFSWGDNSDGQVGDPGLYGTVVSCPTRCGTLTNAIDVAGGQKHSVAVLSNGTVYAWGDNQYGQIGDGTYTDRTSPVQVPGLTNVVAVAANGGHTIVRFSSNALASWGNNGSYQLGCTAIGTNTKSNVPVPCNMPAATAIACGDVHSLAIDPSGTVYGWGLNSYGELGIRPYLGWYYPLDELESAVPLSVSVSNAIAISGGIYHSLILKNDGTIWALGRNSKGQLGDGTTTDRNVAVQVVF